MKFASRPARPHRRSALRGLLLPFIIVAAFVTVLLGPGASTALAADCTLATNCVVDQQGANDQPNQKDLTRLQITSSNAAGMTLNFNFDDLAADFGGANTGDGCALFDTDGDGNANYSLCTTYAGQLGTASVVTLYSCGDDKSDRCTQSFAVVSPSLSTCSIAQTDSNPFTNPHTTDSTVTCTVVFADFVGTPQLIDVCSFPSGQPNSSPSDCIVQPTGGPSAATFRTFSASATKSGVQLRWKTASEVDTLGFNVYREVKGKRVKVNRSLIASASIGGTAGHSYSFLDRLGLKAKAPRYWLQVVDLDGKRTWYGPARVGSARS